MQSTNNRIAIHERTPLELLDLAVAVVRAYLLQLLIGLAWLAIPCALANDWLLASAFGMNGGRFEETLDPLREDGAAVGYIFLSIVLVCIQAPFATSLITLYIGQLMFVARPKWASVRKDFAGALWRLGFYLGFFRLICLVVFPSLGRPFTPEAILLEKPPGAALWRRIGSLHSGQEGLLVGRSVVFFAVATMLTCFLWAAMVCTRNILFETWRYDTIAMSLGLRFEFPLAMWLVAGFMAVVRFLNYLDLRIRREGWEIELRMKNAAQQLAGDYL